DEVDQPFVSPMKIFEEQHERTSFGHRLEEAAPGSKGFRARITAQLGFDADQWSQMRLEHLHLTRVVDEVRDCALEFAARRFVVVALDDSGLRLHHLGQGPERDALAVGERPALSPEREYAADLDGPKELVHEARLSDPRNPNERHELGR